MFDNFKLMQDYGKKRALQNEFLIIPAKFRENKEKFKNLMDFIIETIPNQIKDNEPISIIDFEGNNVSPYDHKINSFIINDSSKYYSSINELVKDMDEEKVLALFKTENIELIGIDESKVELPFQGSRYAYLKSIAFRMSKKDGKQEEVVGPLVHDLEVSFEDSATFEKKIQFWGYLRNLYVACLAVYNAVKSNYNPILFMHGPLVRTMGGFTDVFLTKDDSIRILSISSTIDDFEDTIFAEDEEGKTLIDGEKLLKQFHKEEIENYDIIYKDVIKKMDEDPQEFKRWNKSLPFDQDENLLTYEKRENFPGLSLYMWLINQLYSVCKKYNVPLVSVVENIESSTEFVQYLLPPLLNKNTSALPSKIISLNGRQFPLRKTSSDIRQFPERFYRYIFHMIKNLNITDSVVTTYLLEEGDYTTPIRTCRYLTRRYFEEHWGHTEYGMSNSYESIVNYYFNPEKKRVLFSFLRTTPLREPIRVEFFDIYDDNYHEVLGATYLLSLLYPNYGLPIILKYVDEIARTHKEYPKKVLEYAILDLMRGGDFNIQDVLIISKGLQRNYFQR